RDTPPTFSLDDGVEHPLPVELIETLAKKLSAFTGAPDDEVMERGAELIDRELLAQKIRGLMILGHNEDMIAAEVGPSLVGVSNPLKLLRDPAAWLAEYHRRVEVSLGGFAIAVLLDSAELEESHDEACRLAAQKELIVFAQAIDVELSHYELSGSRD